MAVFINGVEQGGLSDVISDTTPQLGGDLDANGSDITGVGHVGFLASQDASAGANDLDDYEEGTFTPSIGDDSLDGSGEGQVYNIQSGQYTKIGERVFYQCRVRITDLGTLSSAQFTRLMGLPFTSNSAAPSSAVNVGYGESMAIAATENVGGFMGANAAYASLQLWDAVTGITGFRIDELSVSGDLIISGHYRV